ncbi:MAG: ATP-binding cassette domain-containing protein, partial [Planctomycetota bacterium]
LYVTIEPCPNRKVLKYYHGSPGERYRLFTCCKRSIAVQASSNTSRRKDQVASRFGVLASRRRARRIAGCRALYRLPTAELERRVRTILDMIGLTERADHRASTFSGGMQRRLNLGIALVHEPSVLLLDEPTAGVDPQSRNHLFEGIRRLNSEGMTILYTSHYMEEVQALCDRIGILDHGRMIACDTLPHLLGRLPSQIRFRVAQPPANWNGLETAGTKLTHAPDASCLECHDPATTLVHLTTWCGERSLRLTRLESETPTLEKVFLHLTGDTLRD